MLDIRGIYTHMYGKIYDKRQILICQAYWSIYFQNDLDICNFICNICGVSLDSVVSVGACCRFKRMESVWISALGCLYSCTWFYDTSVLFLGLASEGVIKHRELWPQNL